MLERVQVQGFRSLQNFKLDVRPGLNVLVGPNGVGKTNIIMFFEFLRALTTGTVDEAIARFGGVAQVFAKQGRNNFAESVSSVVVGTVEVEQKKYRYQYEFELAFSVSYQAVTFKKQRLGIVEVGDQATFADLDFEAASGDEVDFKDDHLAIIGSEKFAKNNPFVRQEESNSIAQSGHFRQNSLQTLLFGLERVSTAVRAEFSGRFVLNVVPSHVKKPEDSIRKPGIDSDGSGVSATLFAIQRGKAFIEEGRNYFFDERPLLPSWNNILDLIRIAVPSIKDIAVNSDPFDNLLRCQVTIKDGRYTSVLPLSALSDGTVKWISLILRLTTSNSAVLLEEPENYLHPLMQREIVRLLRDSVTSTGFTIVSTHSETLINSVRPDELVIVDNASGGTSAKRVANAKDIEQEINMTGFGLGYYYLAEAVEAER